MLSTITAAETQFRHEDAQRRKEIALARVDPRTPRRVITRRPRRHDRFCGAAPHGASRVGTTDRGHARGTRGLRRLS